MADILLLNPPSSMPCARVMHRAKLGESNYLWPSVDLVYLGAILHEAGLDFEFRDDQVPQSEGLFRYLEERAFKTIVSTYSPFIEDEDLALLGRIRKCFPDTRILVLATHTDRLDRDHCRKVLENHPFLDALVFDFASNGVVDYLAGDRGDLANLFHLVDGEMRGRVGPLPKDVELPVPPHEKFASDLYYHYDGAGGRMTSVMASFGCIMPCSFCWAPDLYPVVATRTPENLVAEMEAIAARGIREVYFHDYTFAYHRQPMFEFCRLLAERDLGLRWYCSTRIGVLTPELLDLMRAAGCRLVELGIESGNYEVRKKYGKADRDERIRDVVRMCHERGIRVGVFVILGLPEEDRALMDRSVAFVESLDVDYVAFNILWAEPNTQLAADLEGRIVDVDRRASMHHLNFEHPTIDQEEILKYRRDAWLRFYLRPRKVVAQLAALRSPGRLKILYHLGKKVLLQPASA